MGEKEREAKLIFLILFHRIEYISKCQIAIFQRIDNSAYLNSWDWERMQRRTDGERERCQLFYPHLKIVEGYGPRDRPAEFAASAENLNPSEPGKKKRPPSRPARHETAAASS